MRRRGAAAEPRESLSQWEMTNAICPEHSACVNPRRVPAGPHPTLRPLHPPLTLSASTGRVDQSRRSSGLRRRRSQRTNSGIYAWFCVCSMRSRRAETSSHKIMLHLLVFQRRWSAQVYENHFTNWKLWELISITLKSASLFLFPLCTFLRRR